jgi:chorismate lyase/3-hydroxybenzoate synthase
MRNPVSLLHGTGLSDDAPLTQTVQWKNSVLGTLCFSADAVECPMQTMHADREIPCLRVPMKRLDAGDSVCDVWHGNAPLTQGQCGAIHYRHDDGVLFGVMVLSETLFEGDTDQTPLQQTTDAAYRQVFALLDKLRFPYLFRFWNYLTEINGHSFGRERYHQFNRGRQDAFLAHGRDVVGNVPAACALGKTQGPLTIAFFAGRVAPLNIENPRQVSAYKYPPQYGPRSPMFSRATLARLGHDEVLFVSGTASIVGHATLHQANVVAQTRETMTNIKAVLSEANRLASHTKFDLSSLVYKVYVRHPADLAQIRAELTHCVGDALKAVYLQADVCRQDLLLEIEATAAHPLVFVSGATDRTTLQ